MIATKTQREADWIEALSAYYRNHENTPVNVRLGAYNAAMEQMARRYPDDYEAQVFYALTLQASASKTDLTYVNQLKSAAILEKLYEGNPQHPGVSHFLIHAYDFTPLAEKGIAATEEQMTLCKLFEEAYSAAQAGDKKRAGELFMAIAEKFPEDYPTQIYLKRIAE